MTDHFSRVSKQYAEARPTYPDALFDWLAAQCPARDQVWDAGCGSGQASLALAERFAHVRATDISQQQLDSAPRHPSIDYRTGTDSGLPDGAADLVTVAQALHWFDLDAFYAEVRRVLKPDGLIAVWSYGIASADDDALSKAMRHLHDDIVGPYWPPQRHDVENGYANLAFPFVPIEAPTLPMTVQWNLQRLLGYFRSWSATARMSDATGRNPIDDYAPVLGEAWGDVNIRTITWPLMIRAGRLIT